MAANDVVIEVCLNVTEPSNGVHNGCKIDENPIIADAKSIMMSEEELPICVICIEEIVEEKSQQCAIFNCGHELHVPCAIRYVTDRLEKNLDVICPVCRYIECPCSTQAYAKMRDQFGVPPPRGRNGTIASFEMSLHFGIPSSRPGNNTQTMVGHETSLSNGRQTSRPVISFMCLPRGDRERRILKKFMIYMCVVLFAFMMFWIFDFQ